MIVNGRNVMMTETELREALAEYAHNAWSGWMEYLFSKGTSVAGTWTMPAWAVERWTRQMQTSYAELTEVEKNSDREEADAMLALVARFRTPEPAILLRSKPMTESEELVFARQGQESLLIALAQSDIDWRERYDRLHKIHVELEAELQRRTTIGGDSE